MSNPLLTPPIACDGLVDLEHLKGKTSFSCCGLWGLSFSCRTELWPLGLSFSYGMELWPLGTQFLLWDGAVASGTQFLLWDGAGLVSEQMRTPH